MECLPGGGFPAGRVGSVTGAVDLHAVEAAHDGVPVVRQVSGTFPVGSITALLGPNGAGKSTLLHVLAGVHPLAGGLVRCGTMRLVPRQRVETAWRATVSLVMHDPDDQLFGATVCEDVSLGPTNLRLPRAEVTQRVDEALAALALEEVHDTPPQALSHGQKLRVVLAGIAAMRPRVLLLDEPTSGLDALAVADLVQLVARWRSEDRVVVISTHDVEFAWRVADTVLVLDGGRVREWGPRERVLGSIEACHGLGLQPPAVVAAHGALRHAGIPVPPVPPRSLAALYELVEDAA